MVVGAASRPAARPRPPFAARLRPGAGRWREAPHAPAPGPPRATSEGETECWEAEAGKCNPIPILEAPVHMFHLERRGPGVKVLKTVQRKSSCCCCFWPRSEAVLGLLTCRGNRHHRQLHQSQLVLFQLHKSCVKEDLTEGFRFGVVRQVVDQTQLAIVMLLAQSVDFTLGCLGKHSQLHMGHPSPSLEPQWNFRTPMHRVCQCMFFIIDNLNPGRDDLK